MEEIIAIASAVPVLLSLTALITTVISFRERAKAENKFVDELSKIIAQMDAVTHDQESKVAVRSPDKPNLTFAVNVRPRSGGFEAVTTEDPKYSVKAHDSSENLKHMYHLYFSGVKGRGENKELPDYVKKALANLDKRNRGHIVKALNQPSVKGRMRYFDKVLKMALNLSGAH
ncbi:hypothetical protein [Pseudomonas soli]|uniref:Uncharacterized protein n=1 Tax=Pseudomonas soli TaxID=1306993 RepID=A0A2V4ICC2_9PSED|nr:hypothetical protein [Pseudomonas soli]PYB84162.1 hypothetical protein DMX07_06355 [Pseudomonas soli]